MGTIKVMETHLANMIAAGEVIERPSSVVKELVENAIDAKATHIQVFIEGAGRKRIVVKDDGCGMDEHDAVLAFTRHASSKIKDEYDLFKIKTMGFRGEALPSIAAISKVTMTTSTKNGKGSRVYAEQETIRREDDLMMGGTTFEVEELFYNTPVRLKYLKSDSTEIASCLEVMQRLALSYPSIAFSFTVEGKEAFQTTGRGDLLEVIARLYGSDLAKRMLPFHYGTYEFEVEGFIAKPEVARSSRYFMITILNGRNVYAPRIQKALQEAYRSFLFHDQFPFVVLHIRVEPTLVDVNVHPAKREVRLSCEENLTKSIIQEVKSTLQTLTQVQEVILPTKKQVEQPQLFQEQRETPFVVERPTLQETRHEQEKSAVHIPFQLQDSIKEETNYELKTNSNQVSEPETKVDTCPNLSTTRPTFRILGQLHKTYLVLEGENGFYLLDQHAAMERIQFERIQKSVAEQHTLIEPLFPLMIDLSLAESKRLTGDKLSLLKQAGIAMEMFGPTTWKITTLPAFFAQKDEEQRVRAVIEQVIRKHDVDLAYIQQDIIASMACKSSIKANDVLSMREMEDLLDQLFACEQPRTCPHGRPTMLHFTTYDIEKMFKRSGV